MDGMTRTKDTSEKSLWKPADAVGCRRSSINKMFRQKGDLVLEEHRNSSPMVVQSTCTLYLGEHLRVRGDSHRGVSTRVGVGNRLITC